MTVQSRSAVRAPQPSKRAPAHAEAQSPLGASAPRQDGPPDLRLIAVALAAWAAAAFALCVPGWTTAVAAAGCCLVAGALLVAGARVGAASARRRGGGSRPGTAACGRPRTGAGGCRRTLLNAIAAALTAAAAAGGSAALHAADVRRGPVPDLADRHAAATVELTVSGDPFRTRPAVSGSRRTPGAVMFRAEVTRVTGRVPGAGGGGARYAESTRTPVLVIVRQWDGPPDASWREVLPSTGLRVPAELMPPAGRGPAQDIGAVLRVRGEEPPQVVREPSGPQRLAGRLRAGLRDASDGLGRDERGLLPGLVVGDTSRISADLEEAFRATDMTHLLAVSGSNLMIVLVLLIGPPGRAQLAERRGLAGRLGLPLRTTAVLAALLTLAFVLVCRPDASVLRAAACGLVAVLAIATGRRRSLLPALAAAVLALLLFDPWLAVDFGFVLSVLATGSLLTVAPRWSAALRRRGVPGRPAEALAAAAAAQVVCAPVVAVLAAHVSLVAVPCNLLAEFAVAPATVLGFAALAAAPLAPSVAEWLAWLAGWPTHCIALVARKGADLPGAEIDWPGGWGGALLLALLTVLVLYLAVRVRLLRRPWLCVFCTLVVLFAVVRPLPLVRPLTGWPPAGWRIVACDVGQGDAVVLATGVERTAVVVDTGPEPRTVDRCLRRLGVTSVPLVVLTHFHADHVAGLSGVLRGRSVGAVQTTTLREPPGQAESVRRTVREAGVRLVRAEAGEWRRSGELSWEVLWPPGSPGTPPGAGAPPVAGANDASVTLLARSAGLTVLLPGDLEPEAQRRLLTAHPDLPAVDVLKAAHHGSAYQYPRLIRRLRPRIALISAGADNPYGHPARRTLAAFRDLGALVARTDVHGSIAVTGGARGTSGRDSGGAVEGGARAPAVVTERGAPPGAARAAPGSPAVDPVSAGARPPAGSRPSGGATEIRARTRATPTRSSAW